MTDLLRTYRQSKMLQDLTDSHGKKISQTSTVELVLYLPIRIGKKQFSVLGNWEDTDDTNPKREYFSLRHKVTDVWGNRRDFYSFTSTSSVANSSPS